MAVSQFLRPGSLIDAVKGCLTPDVIRGASSLVGEPEAATRQTLNSAVPSVLGGLTNMVSSTDGANTLAGMIRDGGFGAAVDNTRSLFAGGAATNNMVNSGTQLLSTIFGGRTSAVSDLLARTGGVSGASATKLMSLCAPLVLGVLGKRAAAQGLNSSGLANALLSEKSDIAAAAPAGLSRVLTAGPVPVPSATTSTAVGPEPISVQHWKEPIAETVVKEPVHLEHFAEPTPRAVEPRIEPARIEPRRGGLGWMPLLLLGLAALALLMFLRGRTPRVARSVTTTASETANTAANAARDAGNTATNAAKEAAGNMANATRPNIGVPEGSVNYTLDRFLGDNTAVTPKNFVFDDLNFNVGSAQPTAPSTGTITDLSKVLKAHPDAQVQLVGHTDNIGNPAANQALSLNRATVVKGMLVRDGVAATRISTAGMGQDHPIASNGTGEGRARNRRIELNVTRK